MESVKLKLTLTDEQVIEMLREHRWPDGVRCPYCGSESVIRYGKAPNKQAPSATAARRAEGSSAT